MRSVGIAWAAILLVGAAPGQPLPVAHRGLLRHAPENTLANFRACLELRLGFEMDVRRCRDGALVCIHDASVERTTDGRGAVAGRTLRELKALDAGSWFHAAFAGERIPTVEEVFALLASHPGAPVLVAVDLKSDDAALAADVVGLARRHGVLDRLLFIGLAIGDAELRRRLRAAAPEAHVACLAETAEQFRAALADPASDWVYVRDVPGEADVRRVHETGKRLFIAGPKVSGHEPENWTAAARAGLDAILTDCPLELRAILRRGPATQPGEGKRSRIEGGNRIGERGAELRRNFLGASA
jgi:glycerophosphoryl diester phosphodiesterase